MKKIISVICSVAVILSLFSMTGYASEESDGSLCFALASDLHYNQVSEEELGKTNDDAVYWYANRRAALEEESGFIIDEFLSQCAEDDSIQYVLISGDLADNGRTIQQEHYDVAAKLAAFEAETGKEVYVINGNHDAADDCSTSYDDFKRIYADFGYDHALTTTDYDCSYTADLGEKYRLIALDTNNPDESTEDGMNLKKIMWVREQAEKAYDDGRYPILMMHHNLLDHLPMQRIISRNFIVRFHYTTATMFADWGIKLVMTGHEHCSDATSYTTVSGNKIYDLATTSLTMYPLAYRVITATDEQIRYESLTIDSIDTSALLEAQPEFTSVQADAMNEGMNEYALGFLKAGVEYRLALSLTPEKLGISEDDFYYGLVMNAVDGLTELLDMPLYGENSVQSLGEEYGIEIPDSSYKNLWDLATTLVSAHYAGEEAYSLDTAEVTILLRGVSLILKDVLSNYNDEIILSAVTQLMRSNGMDGITNTLTKFFSEEAGGIRADEYMAAALLAPFLYEFAFDSDTVNDNNGVIEGYGTTQRTQNTEESAKLTFTKLLTWLKLSFTYILKIFHLG